MKEKRFGRVTGKREKDEWPSLEDAILIYIVVVLSLLNDNYKKAKGGKKTLTSTIFFLSPHDSDVHHLTPAQDSRLRKQEEKSKEMHPRGVRLFSKNKEAKPQKTMAQPTL